LFKNLIHPAGFKQYADFRVDETILANNISTLSYSSNVISGSVNVNSSIYVTGTNTLFNVANTNNVITIGTQIAVNSEIRTISSILSNTTLRVSSAFTQTANNQELIIIA
jgi:hypothetical protein